MAFQFKVGNKFVAVLPKTTVTQAQVAAGIDIFEITAPANTLVYLHEVCITQKTEAGDAEAEMLHFILKRGVSATSGSGGSTATPVPVESGSTPASGITAVEIFNTTPASSGTITKLLEECVHTASGFRHVPPPDRMFSARPAERLILSLGSTIADDIDICGYVVFQEVTGTSELERVS